MGSNHKIDIKYFLSQLLSGKLSKEEQNSLREYILANYKDNELDSLMHEHWSSLNNQENVIDDIQMLVLKNKIISKIYESKISGKEYPRTITLNWKNNLLRIAAMLFLPLLVGSMIVFYQMNKKLNQLHAPMAMQQVMASPGSRVHFTLPDETEVWLNSGSTLEFPINLSLLDQRQVRLTGQGYFKVAHDKDHPFFVETQQMIVKALGTSFDVSSYADDRQITSTLEDGSIAIMDLQGNEVARLSPGQQAILDKTSSELAVMDVETILTTSWKDGKLIFRRTSLPEVSK